MKLIVSEIEKKMFCDTIDDCHQFLGGSSHIWYDKSSDESKQTKLQDEKEIIKPWKKIEDGKAMKASEKFPETYHNPIYEIDK